MKNKAIGGERSVCVGDLGVKAIIGTVDKGAQSSVYINLGLWVQPLEENLSKLSSKLKFRCEKYLRKLAKDNLGGFKLLLFNLSSSDSPQSIEVGNWSYIGLETTIIFNDGDSFLHTDLRFIEMAEDIINYVCSMPEFNKLKYRPTRNNKAA